MNASAATLEGAPPKHGAERLVPNFDWSGWGKIRNFLTRDGKLKSSMLPQLVDQLIGLSGVCLGIAATLLGAVRGQVQPDGTEGPQSPLIRSLWTACVVGRATGRVGTDVYTNQISYIQNLTDTNVDAQAKQTEEGVVSRPGKKLERSQHWLPRALFWYGSMNDHVKDSSVITVLKYTNDFVIAGFSLLGTIASGWKTGPVKAAWWSAFAGSLLSRTVSDSVLTHSGAMIKVVGGALEDGGVIESTDAASLRVVPGQEPSNGRPVKPAKAAPSTDSQP